MEWTPRTPQSRAGHLSGTLGVDRLVVWQDDTDVVPPTPADTALCRRCQTAKAPAWDTIDLCEACWKRRLNEVLFTKLYSPSATDPHEMRLYIIRRRQNEA